MTTPKWTAQTVYEHNQRLLNRKAPSPQLERPVRDDALAAPQVEGPDTAQFLVRVTSFRRRLLDEDNLAVKFHVDCCRYAGLIPSDAPSQTHIEVRQEKVKGKDDERTEIEITTTKEELCLTQYK